jgi:TolB-like protein
MGNAGVPRHFGRPLCGLSEMIMPNKEMFMKKAMFVMVMAMIGLIGLLDSCVSLTDRPIPMIEIDSTEIIGEVQVAFTSWQPVYIIMAKNIKDKAYSRLLEQAKMEYGGDVDIKNMTIKGSFSYHNLWFLALVGGLGMNIGTLAGEPGVNFVGMLGIIIAGNFQKITATGNVVVPRNSLGNTPRPTRPSSRIPSNATGIDSAISNASRDLIYDLPAQSTVAVINVSSNSRELSAYIVDELEYQLVTAKKFTIVDRKTLDTIRSEQDFQMSGDVNDASAVSIGQMLGATIVITGTITGTGSSQRLSLKALDVKTAQIITMVREAF